MARERASVPESAASPRRPPRGPHPGLSFVVPSVVREPCEAPAAGWSRPARTLLEGRWLWVDLPATCTEPALRGADLRKVRVAGLSATSEREVVACAEAFVGLGGAPGLCGAPPTAPAVPRAARGAGCSRFIDWGPRPQPPAEERLALGQGAWSWCGSGRGGALGTKTRRGGRVPQASVPRCPGAGCHAAHGCFWSHSCHAALVSAHSGRCAPRARHGFRSGSSSGRPSLSWVVLGVSAPPSVTAASRAPRAAGPTAPVGESGIREWGE